MSDADPGDNRWPDDPGPARTRPSCRLPPTWGLRSRPCATIPSWSRYGACRLCTVEVIGDGWSRLVTACNYPIRQEIEVLTASETVIRGRRMIVELLAGPLPGR